MNITREQILHLAELARIRLTEEEVLRFESELPGILSFVEELASLKADIDPLASSHALTNSFREDEVIAPLGNPEELKEAFLAYDKDGYLAIPQIFDRRKT